MQRKAALTITGVTRHQYYHKPKAGKGGRPLTCSTDQLVEELPLARMRSVPSISIAILSVAARRSFRHAGRAMSKTTKATIEVQGATITVVPHEGHDYQPYGHCQVQEPGPPG